MPRYKVETETETENKYNKGSVVVFICIPFQALT